MKTPLQPSSVPSLSIVRKRSSSSSSCFSTLGDVKKATNDVVNHGAFSFLQSCDEAQIDWTVAQPLTTKIPPWLSDASDVFTPESLMLYRSVGATPELKKSVLGYFKKQGIECNDENIVIGSGVFGIFNNLCSLMDIKNRDEEILMTTPTFGAFYTHCNQDGLKTDFLQTNKESDWEIDPKELDNKLTNNPNIKMLLLNFPNNPTGKVMSRESAEKLTEVLFRHPEVLIVSDEILSDMVLDPSKEHFSIAQLPQMKERVVVINSPAKSRALASSNVAFAYFPKDLAEKYREMRNLDIAPDYIQSVVAKSLMDIPENSVYLSGNRNQYSENIKNIEKQIDLLNKSLGEHFGEKDVAYVKPYIENPEAGNVTLLDFSGLKEKHLVGGGAMKSGLGVAKFLLEKASIGTVPGECFFLPSEAMLIRIPTSTPQDEISLGFGKMLSAFKQNLRNQPGFTPNPDQGKGRD